jgi:hypothetical protein
MNLRAVVIGMMSALVVIPMNFILVALFTWTSATPQAHKYPVFSVDETGLVQAGQTLLLEKNWGLV